MVVKYQSLVMNMRLKTYLEIGERVISGAMVVLFCLQLSVGDGCLGLRGLLFRGELNEEKFVVRTETKSSNGLDLSSKTVLARSTSSEVLGAARIAFDWSKVSAHNDMPRRFRNLDVRDFYMHFISFCLNFRASTGWINLVFEKTLRWIRKLSYPSFSPTK